MDRIVLRDMKFYAYHGVLPEEQEMGQEFIISAEMAVDLTKAGLSDDLNDTVDYSEVYRIIKDITEKNKFRLIERLADVISREILSRFEMVTEITVIVKKPQAPIGGELRWALVEIKRVRDGR